MNGQLAANNTGNKQGGKPNREEPGYETANPKQGGGFSRRFTDTAKRLGVPMPPTKK